GQRAYGIGAAAEVYFGKTVQELTLPEIAMLAGLPQAPSKFNPIACPDCALHQRAYVLRRMRELEYITEAEYQAAKNAPLGVEYHSYIVEVSAPYAGELARTAVVARFGEKAAYTNGYRVITTIDSRLQPLAVQAVRNGVLTYARRHGWDGPVGTVDLTQQPKAEVLQSVLDEYLDAGQLEPAIVMSVAGADAETQQAQVFTDAGRQLIIPWEGLEWAGAESATTLLTPGDIIYVEPIDETTAWLAPVPDVQGALVSIDPSDGAIVALVGGFDFQLSKFNRVMDANRQPGSSFKPFIYSAALENGFTPATLVNDAPVVFEDAGLGDAWRPENYSGKFYGPTRLRKGFINSRNLVSIRVLRGTGIDNAIDHIAQFGFPPERMPRNLSLSLGSLSVPPLMMARGYTVFANGGYLIEPYIIQRITGGDGVLYEATPAYACGDCISLPEDSQPPADAAQTAAPVKTALTTASPTEQTKKQAADATPKLELVAPPLPAAPRVINPQNIYLMTDMMRDVIQHGTGRRALVLGRDDLAGKTGTTNNFRDAWFSGFNHALVTTVWLGYDEGKSLGYGEAGSRAALPMWIDYMGPALEGVPEIPLQQPEGIVTVRIDRETGLRVGADYPDAMFEIFRADRVPPEAPKSLQEQPVDADPGGLF
ncbi:MAG TPA: penicillin-binding transpeptidase domain-containing protein, partial [Gammaproteobacteria bacterium]|nr:penicillin-binding transpeptidase domain-containing protein [Gammaproteobacteria bacterium]